jgi:hypothetical protein
VARVVGEKYVLVKSSWPGREGFMSCCTPQIPSDGSEGQGGNWRGRVRMCGHLPSRARVVMLWEAVRRASISEGVRLEETTMKPSRSREALRSWVGVGGMLEIAGIDVLSGLAWIRYHSRWDGTSCSALNRYYGLLCTNKGLFELK